MTTFAEETLELARSMTTHHVEINEAETDADCCALMIGDLCDVYCHPARKEFMVTVGHLDFGFGDTATAVQAADTIETTMAAIREAAKISREKVPA